MSQPAITLREHVMSGHWISSSHHSFDYSPRKKKKLFLHGEPSSESQPDPWARRCSRHGLIRTMTSWTLQFSRTKLHFEDDHETLLHLHVKTCRKKDPEAQHLNAALFNAFTKVATNPPSTTIQLEFGLYQDWLVRRKLHLWSCCLAFKSLSRWSLALRA